MALLLIEGFEANTPSGGSFSFGEMESHYRLLPGMVTSAGNCGGAARSRTQPGCTRLL